MKKTLIAAFVVCGAMLAHAATCAWGTEYVEDLSETDVVGSYFLVSLTGNSVDGIAVNTEGALVDANGAIASTLMSGSFDDPTSLLANLDGLSAADNGTYLALIVVDNANAYYGVSGAEMLTGISDTPPLNAEPITFTNYTDSYGALAMQTQNATVAVPEPTSGLLMLVGLAGLALRRRRA